MEEAWVLRNFEQMASLPGTWEMSATVLLAAAQMLRDGRDAVREQLDALKEGDAVPLEGMVQPVELMLRGFSLENLMKALWVKQGNAIVHDGKYLRPANAGDHDLLQLSDAVGLALDAKSRDVLKRLSTFTSFVGRYPIPTRAKRGVGEGWSTPSDYDTLEEIRTKLGARLA